METTVALPTDDTTVARGKRNPWVCPAFKVSSVFGSHMVLQQMKPIRVWGFSTAHGSAVTGTFMGETVTATVGDDGKWTLTFSAHPYTREPQSLTVSDDRGHEAVLEDILIGDVYLIGGQSNAELTLAPCLTLTPSVEFSQEDNFRLLTQTQAYVYAHQEWCEHPQVDLINPDWHWQRPDEQASRAFSAIGWYFAKEMTKQIDIPLGMIMMCAGGACIRELLPADLAHACGYTAGANVREGGYYNALIHPLVGLACKAQIFFQGESEGGCRQNAERYCYELALLVADERRRWGQDFPFYNIQLSDYRTEGGQYFPWLDIVRMQQFDAQKVIPDSALTVDMDLGSPDDWSDFAHSPRKLELAERLAKQVLAREYGIGSEKEVTSPMPVAAALSVDRKTITVEFTHVGQGLVVTGHAPMESLGMEVQGFSVGAYDHKLPARATVTGRCIVTVEVPEGATDLSSVNYAFAVRITPENADLRGGNNLPAPAFMMRL